MALRRIEGTLLQVPVVRTQCMGRSLKVNILSISIAVIKLLGAGDENPLVHGWQDHNVAPRRRSIACTARMAHGFSASATKNSFSSGLIGPCSIFLLVATSLLHQATERRLNGHEWAVWGAGGTSGNTGTISAKSNAISSRVNIKSNTPAYFVRSLQAIAARAVASHFWSKSHIY